MSVIPISTYLPILSPTNTVDSQTYLPPVLDLSSPNKSESPTSTTYSDEYRFIKTKMETCMSPRSLSSPSTLSEGSEILETDPKDLNANYNSFKSKQTRPFKAYIKDPLTMTLGNITTDLILEDSSEAYAKFKEKMLAEARSSNNSTNKNMRRVQSQNGNVDDPSYWEKRKKNNIAAKKSRDLRRAKEDEMAIRCAFLEKENLQLRIRLAHLENERDRLQRIARS